MTFAEVKEVAKTATDKFLVIKKCECVKLNNGSFVPGKAAWEVVENRESQKSDSANIANGYLKIWTVENFKTWAYKY